MSSESLPIEAIVVDEGRRPTRNVAEFAESIRVLGLLNPITVTSDHRLVAGRNRLAACKFLGWETIPATVVELDELHAELAEIDENLIRNPLTALEYDEHLARRKKIFEAMNPRTKRGGDRKSQEAKSNGQNVHLKSFADDTAAKIGVTSRTVRRAVEVATSIPAPLRDAIRETPLADNKTDLQKLARLRPDQQEAVVAKVIATPTLTIPQAQRAVADDVKRAAMEVKAATVEDDAPSWEIIEGDCFDVLATIEPGSVRLVFADPPYNIGLDYGEGHDDAMDPDDFMEWSEAWMRAAVATLATDGSMWVLINDEWADVYGSLLRDCGLTRRAWIKWYESFGVNNANNFNRTSRHLFYMVKDPKRFVFHREAVNRPSDRQAIYGDARADPGGKVWDDVWGINPPVPRLVGNATERVPGDFPTQLPLALLRPIVGCASDPGDLVLDPFSGSGTTLAACIELGRRGLGIERSAEFIRMARMRLLTINKNGDDDEIA